ncbi:uncharacterized protein [Diadema antillarum]|uniref:uncharacterized protein n=1 Tax=Diadema antillarum TaxID=105358 RepID=UPI003A8B7188
MSADVHSTRHARLVKLKLAGPAAGSYDGGQKMSTQKRKRDKAQEQLRTRMRQRINGNGASSTLIHSKRRSTLLDGKGDISLSASLGNSSTMEVAAKDLQGGNYWRTQQDRLNAFQNSRSPRISKNQTVPLQELVDRVLHRKEQNFGLGTKASPMTIRAYKTPVAPFAIPQNSLVKKMVMMKPIQRPKREDKGPFVLVLQRNEGDGMADSARNHRKLGPDTMADSEDQRDAQEEVMTMSSAQVLPPVNSDKTAEQSPVELKTWRPPLDGMHHQPAVLPEAEDRSVTNYRLQLQHANKLAESRFEFPNRDNSGMPSHKSVEEMTMQSLNPLPPIQSVLSGGDTKETDGTSQTTESTSSTDANTAKTTNTNVNNSAAVRTSSKDEILNMKKAHKEAKRQKQSEEEFTLLRTRKRFTNKTKQFKNELQRARQLSAIQEDRSSLGSARLGRLSGRKATLSSASSASSLRSIDESNVSRQSTDTGDVEEKSAEPNRSDSEQSNHTMPAAPPTTPSLDQCDDHDDVVDAESDGSDDESMDQEGAISDDDMASKPQDDSDESGGEAENMEEAVTANSSDESIASDSSSSLPPSTSDSSEEAPENVPQPVVVKGESILDDITWIEGDVPFSESTPSTQADPVREHAR